MVQKLHSDEPDKAKLARGKNKVFGLLAYHEVAATISRDSDDGGIELIGVDVEGIKGCSDEKLAQGDENQFE